MFSIETANPLNPIQITDRAERGVLVIGGWEQNHTRMATFQDALLTRGIASAAFSGFDSIGPLLDDEVAAHDEVVAILRQEDEFFASLPPRMVLRGLQTLRISEAVLGYCQEEWSDQPTTVLTHCAGANVYLLARLIDHMAQGASGRDILPSRAILLEPMLSEGREVKPVAKENLRHEAKVDEDPTYISLKAMRHPDAVALGMKGAAPLGDILRSSGIRLLAKGTMAGTNARVVLGHEDIAAPDSLLTDISGLALDIPVSQYPIVPNTQYKGHGYIFAEPEHAADYISTLL